MFNLYNEILTEHNLHPNNKCSLADATHHQHGINPNCGDEITLSLKLNNNIIEDASFQGSGCAISQASTDIMIDLMLDQPIDIASERLVVDSPMSIHWCNVGGQNSANWLCGHTWDLGWRGRTSASLTLGVFLLIRY